MIKGKGNTQIHVRLRGETYAHLAESARRGRYRSVSALVSHLCDCIVMRRLVFKDTHPIDAAKEIENMFNEFTDHESPDYG